jgi:hypothetical protein
VGRTETERVTLGVVVFWQQYFIVERFRWPPACTPPATRAATD